MKTRLIGYSLFIIALSVRSYAQQVNIGDRCPDVVLQNIINYSSNNVRVSDFRGKVLIIDFWATWCGPCIAMFPKLDSLQDRFQGKVEFMPVAYENTEIIRSFLANINMVKHINVHSVTKDTMLTKMFPHTIIPHYVWINSEGIVEAITGFESITAENILLFLKEQKISLNIKQDHNIGINPKSPAFNAKMANGTGIYSESINDSDLSYLTVLTKYRESFQPFCHYDLTRITCINQSIESLFRIAIGHFKSEYILVNRSIWDVSDSTLYNLGDRVFNGLPTEEQRLGWIHRNGYCYELKNSSFMSNPDKKYDMMLQELNAYFGNLYGITGDMERRKVKCLILIQTDKSNKLINSKIQNTNTVSAYSFSMHNKPLKSFIGELRFYMQTLPPILDETNYADNVDMDITCNMRDVGSVNKELERYGLKIVEAEREINMIVITDKTFNHPSHL